MAGVVSQKQDSCRAFPRLLEPEVPSFQETLSINERRTISLSEEHGEIKTYLKVPAPLFSLYRRIQP